MAGPWNAGVSKKRCSHLAEYLMRRCCTPAYGSAVRFSSSAPCQRDTSTICVMQATLGTLSQLELNLCGEVDVYDAKTVFETHRPLKVVEQRPCKVPLREAQGTSGRRANRRNVST